MSWFEETGCSPCGQEFLSLHRLWIVAWNTYLVIKEKDEMGLSIVGDNGDDGLPVRRVVSVEERPSI